MFGRKKDETASEPGQLAPPERPGAKNRPTPKLREAEAARRVPLAPEDRKLAKAQARQRGRMERLARQDAMRRGEDWAMLPRDRGRERAWVRDVIDARWNVGEFILPIMLIGLPITLVSPPGSTLYQVGFAMVYGVFAVFVIDTAWLWFTVKRRYLATFGETPPRGTAWYAMGRAMAMRRTRMPAPRVARGAKID